MGGDETARNRRWTNRQVVREVDHQRGRLAWCLLLGIALAVVPSAACLLQQNECLKLTYQIAALRTEQERLLEQQRRLRAEIASRQSLDSIEEWAGRNGLIRPSSHEAVVVRHASSERVELLAQRAPGARANRVAGRPETPLRR